MSFLKKFKNFNLISENVKYHIDNNIPFTKNVFRPGSKSYYSLLEEVRNLYDSGKINLSDMDKYFYENTDIGKFGYYLDSIVPLDLPMVDNNLNEAKYGEKNVELNKPMRSSGPKKYKVYVKNPKTGKVILVNFGDVKGGLKSKINDPEARKRFADRHNCKDKKDKTKPGYWSCNLPKYAKNLGLAGGGNFYW